MIISHFTVAVLIAVFGAWSGGRRKPELVAAIADALMRTVVGFIQLACALTLGNHQMGLVMGWSGF